MWAAAGFQPNPAQENAIRHVDGPLYLPAGPGSGKTRVLLWRTLNLIVFHQVAPDAIYLSTFTEKAAQQLKEGLRGLLGMATNFTGLVSGIIRHLTTGVGGEDNQIEPTSRRISDDHRPTRTRDSARQDSKRLF